MKSYTWKTLAIIFFLCFFRILERGFRRHREISDWELCWSIFDFLFLLILFLWRHIFSLHSLLSWPVTWERILFFTWRRGTSCSLVRWKPQPHPHVQMVLRALISGINMQVKSKVNNTDGKSFKMSSKWKPESRILNNALAVYYCLLNQRTQIAQIVIHKLYTYAFMDQPLAVTVFHQTCLAENAAETIPGKKQFAKSRMLQIEEGTFVTLTFWTEVIY